MLPQDIKRHWILGVKIVILLNGMFFKNNICEASDTNGTCQQKNILLLALGDITSECHFSSDALYDENSGIKLCVSSEENKAHTDCCNKHGFDCGFELSALQGNVYSLTLNESTLSTQDIVLMTSPKQKFSCTPSQLYNNSDFLFTLHSCLNKGVKSIRLTDGLHGCKVNDDDQDCKGEDATKHRLIINPSEKRCSRCKPPWPPHISISFPSSDTNNVTTTDTAVDILNNLWYFVEKMGKSNRANVKIGNNKGLISKLPPKDQTHNSFGITASGDFNILGNDSDLAKDLWRSVTIPKEAYTMAANGNGSFLAIFRFTEMQRVEDIVLFNNEMLGIDMGANISNLTDTIDIKYGNVDKMGNIASCRSWDGTGKKPFWITDGCQTVQSNDSITCRCSHLTFFAVLMSPPTGNMSSSDFRSLSYITSAGCGVSMFFLAVGLFIHLFIRKNSVSLGTKILMNLFVALFALNLTFVTNEIIAKLGNLGACVTIAALMHYSMLATVTWFFMEALHLCFNLWMNPSEIQHYMMKILISGWVIPAGVVTVLLALRKYDYIVIYTDDGNSAQMCWIPDSVLHQVVNVSYYGVVFIFNICIFIVTVRLSLRLKSATAKSQDNSSVKANSSSILGLFLMLGITWAFAFLSHGPLLMASYYIFTILNSFQGFFLFIYYYKTSKIVTNKKGQDKATSSTATSNITVSSVVQ